MAVLPYPSAAQAPTTTHPELLMAAALHLMSHYTASDNAPCLKLAAVIERHLKALAALPDISPVLRATCQQLAEQWEQQIEQRLSRKAQAAQRRC